MLWLLANKISGVFRRSWFSCMSVFMGGLDVTVPKTCSYSQGLVIAGLADLTRPAEKLSTSQSAVLTATGTVQMARFGAEPGGCVLFVMLCAESGCG